MQCIICYPVKQRKFWIFNNSWNLWFQRVRSTSGNTNSALKLCELDWVKQKMHLEMQCIIYYPVEQKILNLEQITCEIYYLKECVARVLCLEQTSRNNKTDLIEWWSKIRISRCTVLFLTARLRWRGLRNGLFVVVLVVVVLEFHEKSGHSLHC